MALHAIVVMGVSGSGKTTVASLLAQRLQWRFAEGDAFHPAANVEKMRQGIALTDEDRWPWLDAIAAWIEEHRRSGERCVVSCSALKRAYRKRLSRDSDDVGFAYLHADYDLVAARMAVREGHYMPIALLRSQYDALEMPAADECAFTLSVEPAPAEVVDAIVARLAGLT